MSFGLVFLFFQLFFLENFIMYIRKEGLMKIIYILIVILFKLCLDNGMIFCWFLMIVLVDLWFYCL